MGAAMLRNRRVWIGLVVSIVFLGLLLRSVDRHELANALEEIDPLWLVAAFAVELAALWFRALRWRLILDSHVRIKTQDAFSVVIIGYAANNLLPVRAGELVRAQLLYDSHGASRLGTLGTIVVERIFDGLVLALFLAATIALAGGSDFLRVVAALMTAAFLVATVVLALLALQPRGSDIWTIRLLRLVPATIRPRARVWLGSFLAGLGGLRGQRAWGLVIGTTFISWGLEAVCYWLVGIGFGLDIDFPLYLAVTGAANLAIAAPSTAGGVGPFEFFAQKALTAFGVSAAAATVYALVLHALLLIPVVLLGIALLWRRHLGLGEMLRAGQGTPAEGVADS
ncbi:MAG: flippase-like domain-containing protein [Dehalococcoidia bacterium]|nr:flippase-like domain-containing protein [Dehalococcoidia bacterium]HRC61717.1 lysylphosphatidylglycerol synthase transmembrane domain-containing protein [Dehalococcoidia bacterium]